MEKAIYRILTERTKYFLFSGCLNESASDEEKLIQLKGLITQVRKMAIKRFYQMPEAFRSTYTKEDWIQEAMTIFCDLISTYNPERGPFDNYVRFILSRRLTSFQRNIFKQNPPVNEDLRKILVSWKREHGQKPTAEELSDFTGCGKAEAQKFLDTGLGERVVQRETNNMNGKIVHTAEKNNEIPLEHQYIRTEACRILWCCIEKLGKKLKLLFIRHEFDNISFENLYKKFGKILESKSQSTFQRRYNEKVFEPVRDCVQKKYDDKK